MFVDEDLRALIVRAQAGETCAKEAVIDGNLNLVRSIVYRFANRGIEWDDLFQIGCIGLLKAVERFDMSYEVKFSTYAVPMIIGEIRRFLRDDHPVKISRAVKEMAFRIRHVQEKLIVDLRREPTIQEIATELSLAPQEVVSALEAMQPLASLHGCSSEEGGGTMLLERIPAGDGQDDGYVEKLALKEVISRLPEREQKIVRLRFFHDKTQAEIAAIIGLSQVQVSRIEKQALQCIRKWLDMY